MKWLEAFILLQLPLTLPVLGSSRK